MKIWEKIKLLFTTKIIPWIKKEWKELLVRIELFYTEKILPWIKKNWFEITNLIVLFIVHLMIRNIPDVGFADFIIKLWILGILVYYVIKKVKQYRKK